MPMRRLFAITLLALPVLASSAWAADPCDLVKGRRFLVEIEAPNRSPNEIGAAIFDFKNPSPPPATGMKGEGSGWVYRFETYVQVSPGPMFGGADMFQYQSANDDKQMAYCGVTTSTSAYYSFYPPKNPAQPPQLIYGNGQFARVQATVFELH